MNCEIQDKINEIDLAIETQANIEAQTNKCINQSQMNLNNKSTQMDPNSLPMIQAELHLLKAQQTKTVLLERKRALRIELNKYLGQDGTETVTDESNFAPKNLKITSLLFNFTEYKATKKTFLILTFSNPENPTALQTSQLIEVHKLPFNSDKITPYKLEKPIEFSDLKPDFKINVNVYSLLTEDLYLSLNSFKDNSKKTGMRRVLSGLEYGMGKVGKGVGKGFEHGLERVRDKWNQSISRSSSFSVGLNRSSSRMSSRMGSRKMSHEFSICTSGKSRFDCCGSFAITKESIISDPNQQNLFTDANLELSCKPTENLPKNYITKSLKTLAKFTDNSEKNPSETLSNYGNIFLPTIPPTWEFSYFKLEQNQIYIHNSASDEQPIKVINVRDYEEIRVAEKSECFQRFVLRLIENKHNLSLKTLMKFESEGMMLEWLGRLKMIVEDKNAWR
jgi:hypothetical protein